MLKYFLNFSKQQEARPMNCLDYPFDPAYLMKKKKSIRRELLCTRRTVPLVKKIAVLGGSTTREILDLLDLFLLNHEIEAEFYESEYNQFYQEAGFDNPALMAFGPDVILLHTSYCNLQAFPELQDDEKAVEDLLSQTFKHYRKLWDNLIQTYHCPVIINNFELPPFRLLGNQDAVHSAGRVSFINRLNQLIEGHCSKTPSLYLHDLHYLSASYGLKEWHDAKSYHLYKYACSIPALSEWAFSYSKIIKSLFGKNKKALVLDLDNTLWGGVIGDDGQEGIELGPETSMGQVYSDFQRYIKLHKSLGILLNVNSKNQLENAMLGLTHPDAILKPEDFIVIKANWDSKDQNILSIANELNILPESLVFVDDNPAERHMVRSQLPFVAVPEVSDIEDFIRILDQSGFFEITSLSADDQNRTQMYQTNQARKNAEGNFQNYEEYLTSLDMVAEIKAFEPLYYSRISQLCNKSNQFNLTTKRYTLEEIQQMAENPKFITLSGKLQDKFGDNGLVSMIVAAPNEEMNKESNILDIHLWLMSCRVLKRDMEFAMMDALILEAKRRQYQGIRGYYYPTAKNAMVADFYERMGFTLEEKTSDGTSRWFFDLSPEYKKQNHVITIQ